jgi:transcriptional regulator with XRE-family HTH domain
MGKLFGDRLKDARKAKRMTLQEIADALGVSLNTVWRWEAGRQSPPDDQKKLIANILDVSVSYLLGEVEVFKSSGMVEVTLYDLISGHLETGGACGLTDPVIY